jgi:hypothetical protein
MIVAVAVYRCHESSGPLDELIEVEYWAELIPSLPYNTKYSLFPLHISV